MNISCAVIGMGVMGKNLALNIAEKGFSCIGFDLDGAKTQAAVAEAQALRLPLTGADSLANAMERLSLPRRILLMVPAGAAVEAALASLVPYLEPGDIVADCGNSHFSDTRRREAELRGKGIRFMGIGVSGGEEGARHGPALMPGGEPDAYEALAPILTAIAAKVQEEPCCSHLGPDGAGHFVKMVHNGIEYADMQLICEAFALLRPYAEPEALASTFSRWNEGDLDSYLIAITAKILSQKDPETALPMVDVILDRAGNKGTGIWTSQEALALGIAVPTIAEAVSARAMSAHHALRQEASLRFPQDPCAPAPENWEETVRRALYAAKICAYAQGFALYQEASEIYHWQLDLASVARLFRGGCIIRAHFLDRIAAAFEAEPRLSNLALAPDFAQALDQNLPALRQVVAHAAQSSTPVPALSSALAWFDQLRSATLPHNLLQAQRDYFGAHGFERRDRPGNFHHRWQ